MDAVQIEDPQDPPMLEQWSQHDGTDSRSLNTMTADLLHGIRHDQRFASPQALIQKGGGKKELLGASTLQIPFQGRKARRVEKADVAAISLKARDQEPKKLFQQRRIFLK